MNLKQFFKPEKWFILIFLAILLINIDVYSIFNSQFTACLPCCTTDAGFPLKFYDQYYGTGSDCEYLGNDIINSRYIFTNVFLDLIIWYLAVTVLSFPLKNNKKNIYTSIYKIILIACLVITLLFTLFALQYAVRLFNT